MNTHVDIDRGRKRCKAPRGLRAPDGRWPAQRFLLLLGMTQRARIARSARKATLQILTDQPAPACRIEVRRRASGHTTSQYSRHLRHLQMCLPFQRVWIERQLTCALLALPSLTVDSAGCRTNSERLSLGQGDGPVGQRAPRVVGNREVERQSENRG